MIWLGKFNKQGDFCVAKEQVDSRRFFVRCNEQIRIPQVMVIQESVNHGIMNTKDALALARSADLDLVEISPYSRPPVCHIRDYGKYVFELKQKKKAQSKNTGPQEKQVFFRYVIGEHDLETKANQISDFLAKGFKVRCVVKFKGREKQHADMGRKLLQDLITKLADVASVEKPPSFEGGSLVCRLDIKKD